MFANNRKSISVRIALAVALLIGGFMVTPVHASTVVHYVKQSATGANNGTSWSDAYTDLQSALSAASSGDEIWVAAGTYKPTTGTDQTISFVLKNGVAIYGGFAGTETLRTQRNPSTNLTILSGDIGVAEDNSDNSYHVMMSSGVDTTTKLDGFTITGGNANGSTDGPLENRSGGGMYNADGSKPLLTSITFSGNFAGSGAGMLNNTSDPILTKVTFDSNISSLGGGGMYNYLSSPTLTNVTFKDNSAAEEGGGMVTMEVQVHL